LLEVQKFSEHRHRGELARIATGHPLPESNDHIQVFQQKDLK
jgi:molybdopterin biosynthesis enzyme